MFFTSPSDFFYNSKKLDKYSRAVLNSLVYLLETRAPQKGNFFLNVYLNKSIKNEFKSSDSISYKNYPDNEVFGFMKLYLLKNIGCLVKESVLNLIIGDLYSKTEIPRILQEIYKTDKNVYSPRIIQLLFSLMISTHQIHRINNTNEIYLMNNFISLFFGEEAISKLKKKTPEKHYILVQRWREIVNYLPKGTFC